LTSPGKQIVYHALQVSFAIVFYISLAYFSTHCQNAAEACTTEQLAALDESILNLRTQTTTLVAAAKNLRSSLSNINSTLSTADLVANVHALETEKAEIEARLDSLRKGKAKKVSSFPFRDVCMYKLTPQGHNNRTRSD
jgi:26S proteasome regulatory subunit (ATPase 3-interacting protein)